MSILKEQPSVAQLSALCQKLKPQIFEPCASTQRILACLLSDTLPELGADPSSIPSAVLDLLASLPGISAILFNIKNLIRYFETSATSIDSNSGGQPTPLLQQHKTTYTSVSQVKLSIYSQLEFLLLLLGLTLKTVPLNKIYERAGIQPSQIKELNSIFVGSTLYSLVSQCYTVLSQHAVAANIDKSWSWMSDPKVYGEYLAVSTFSLSNTAAASNASELLFKSVRLLSVDYLKWVFQSLENCNALLTIQKNLRDSDQRTLLISYIIPFISSQLEHLPDTLDPTIWASFLSLFIPQPCSNPLILSQLIKHVESPSSSLLLQRIVILVVSQHQTHSEILFSALLDRWSSPLTIRHSPIPFQKSQTQLLFFWLPQLSSTFLRTTSLSSTYLNGISNHLSALSEQPRLYGMAFAEMLSKIVDANDDNSSKVKPLQFGSMGATHNMELAYWKDDIGSIRDKPVVVHDREQVVNLYFEQLGLASNMQIDTNMESSIVTAEKDNRIVSHAPIKSEPSFEAVSTQEIDSDDNDEFPVYPFDDDDSEDSDDDPTVVRRPHIPPPLYIRDLLAYLNDESDSKIEKVQIALQHASDLIKRKSRFGKELTFHATELASSLVALKVEDTEEDDDEASIKNLHDLRINALAVLVSCEPFIVPPHLAHLLGVGDYSIMQRMVILSSITLGANLLASTNPSTQESVTEFSTKQLPQALHDRFTAYNKQQSSKTLEPFNMKQLEDVTFQVQRSLTEGVPEKAQDQLLGQRAKVLKISSKLKKVRKNNGNPLDFSSINLYAKLAAKHFFFPLLAQWLKLGDRMVAGVYNELFAAHYIKTLALLLYYAYPSSTNIQEMSDEMIQLILSYRTTSSSDEVHIQESLYTAILTVLHVNDSELIASRWARQICIEIKAWLEDTWESVPDPKVKGLGATALYQITEIGAKWERRLVGEMIGLESEGGRDIRI